MIMRQVEARLLGEVDVAQAISPSRRWSIDFTPLSDPIGVSVRTTYCGSTWGHRMAHLLSQPFIRNGTATYSIQLNLLSWIKPHSVENLTSLFAGIRHWGKHTSQVCSANQWITFSVDSLIDPPLQRQIGIFRLSDLPSHPKRKSHTSIQYLRYEAPWRWGFDNGTSLPCYSYLACVVSANMTSP